MSKFQRENRYMVVKLKHLSESQEHALDTILSGHQIDTHTVECVVVESDWPIYEDVWDMVQRMAEGKEEDAQAQNRDEWEQLAYRFQSERDQYRHLSDKYSDLWRSERDRADALAAHVERLKQAGNATDMCTFGVTREAELWLEACEEAPETSLDKLIAEKQAEAFERLYSESQGSGVIARGTLLDEARSLRRQADEPSP